MEGNGQPPAQRASDAEREAVAAVLRRHVAEGRLDLDEFSDRLDDVYGARTNAELEATLSDLPDLPPDEEDEPDEGVLRAREGFRGHLVRYLIVNLFLVGIWLVTDAGHFWPAYPILGWGIGLSLHAWQVYGEGARDDEGH